jgi:hypothetical protein
MKTERLAGLVATAALFAFTQGAAADDCKLTLVASLDTVWTAGGDLATEISVQGKKELFLVDLAGFKSSVSKSVSDALDLKHTALNPNYRVTLNSGGAVTAEAMAEPVVVGNIDIPRMKFLIVPDDSIPRDTAGTLSADILDQYDVEIDPLHNKVNLFSQGHCAGQVVYWTHSPAAVIPMRMNDWAQIVFQVELDGQVFDATLDTGSSRSHIGYEQAANAFGWSGPNAPQPSDEYDPVFKHLSLNGVDITNPKLVIQEQGHSTEIIPVQLGMNILRKFRTYVSYTDRSIFLTSANAPPPDQTTTPQSGRP